jgi:hypothetical protein
VLLPGPGGAKLLELAAAECPDVLVLSDRGPDPWVHLDELRSDPELARLRVLLVASEPLTPERREALLGASVSVVNGPLCPEELSNAVAAVMNVPTRVTVRARVAFEVTGRTADNQVVFGRMLDVSTGGLRLESERVFEKGDVLYCFFSLGAGTPVVFATARVVHGREPSPGRHEYGLEFLDIRLEDRRRIAEFVFRQSGLRAILG